MALFFLNNAKQLVAKPLFPLNERVGSFGLTQRRCTLTAVGWIDRTERGNVCVGTPKQDRLVRPFPGVVSTAATHSSDWTDIPSVATGESQKTFPPVHPLTPQVA